MIQTQHKTVLEALGREPIHPFPARMAPGIALKLVSTRRRRLRILDPMMGSGTALAVARARGHYTFGVDIDPLAVLISKVWTKTLSRTKAKRIAISVLRRAKRTFYTLPLREAYPLGADKETRRFVRYWFDPYSRRQLSALARAIAVVRHKATRDALWCAFSRLIISKQSGASLAMDLSHSRPHRTFETAPVKPFRKFLSAVDRVINNSIDIGSKKRGPAAKVFRSDARKLPLKNNSIDLVLTSPPYLNAIDYIRCSKFSLIWMGYSIAELSEVRATSVGAELGDKSLHKNEVVQKVIASLKLKPPLVPRQNAILSRYIHDMHCALSEVARVLVSKGKAYYVVGENTIRGTFIPTSKILCALAKMVGLTLHERRTRVLPANRRYLPPPIKYQTAALDLRMRREVVLAFTKASAQSHRKKRGMPSIAPEILEPRRR